MGAICRFLCLEGEEDSLIGFLWITRAEMVFTYAVANMVDF